MSNPHDEAKTIAPSVELTATSQDLRDVVKSILVEIVSEALGGSTRARKFVDPPTINSVSVTIYTTSDDKDKEEDVHVSVINQNGTVHATQVFGHDTKFDDDTNTGPVAMNLTTQPLKADAGRLKVRVHKDPFGSATGNGWHMQIEVTAVCSDGTGGVPLAKTEETRIGDGNPIERNWNCQSIG